MSTAVPRPTGIPATTGRHRPPLVVALMCAIGMGCVMFDQTSLVVAAPTIGADLGAGISGLQWLTAIFPLVAASAMPISGLLGERFGARTTLRAGLLVFATGATIAALAPNLAALLAARVVQGVGAALVLPNGPTLLGGNVDLAHRARSVSHWMMASSTGLLLGPLLGGTLAEAYGWRATFAAVVPAALLAVVVTGRLDNTARREAGRLDLAGLATACATLALLSWALIATGRGTAGAGPLLAAYAGTAVLVWVFVRVERRAERPVLDLALFASPRIRAVLLACLGYNAVINGAAFLLSVHLQDTRGLSVTAAGLLLLVANAGMPIAGLLVNVLRPFLSSPTLMGGSLLVLAAAYLAMALGGDLPVGALVVPLVLIGIGCGVLYSLDTSALLDAAQGHQSAPAMASVALMRQIGTVLGIAALASAGQVAVSAGVTEDGELVAFLLSALVLTALGVWLRRRLLAA
ncbi:MFS transporter [Nocardioides ochotonae]|uniref:MFS transporter n=1 Tax=Nocardioides ochotonae TaxID=2685869 RepID=UPI00140DE965|nr:MFS transporter [Nocardioides ochotonae]